MWLSQHEQRRTYLFGKDSVVGNSQVPVVVDRTMDRCCSFPSWQALEERLRADAQQAWGHPVSAFLVPCYQSMVCAVFRSEAGRISSAPRRCLFRVGSRDDSGSLQNYWLAVGPLIAFNGSVAKTFCCFQDSFLIKLVLLRALLHSAADECARAL